MSHDTSKSILEVILSGKEKRAAIQKQLLEKYSGPLISFTLNIPGPCKDSMKFTEIHDIGMKAITEALQNEKILILNQAVEEGAAGPTGFLNVNSNKLIIKEIAVAIEETHPLGRLFDIDVLVEGGHILTRSELKLKDRSCLLCPNTAATICRREQRHSLDELLRKIEEMIETYHKGEVR